ncbi:hypothetical protein NC651_027706 [Populus alba x Populus x berolinensis]|nr:hypothetical protein NC651_027706 [Populus alba x Populus x berolinensis]
MLLHKCHAISAVGFHGARNRIKKDGFCTPICLLEALAPARCQGRDPRKSRSSSLGCANLSQPIEQFTR